MTHRSNKGQIEGFLLLGLATDLELARCTGIGMLQINGHDAFHRLIGLFIVNDIGLRIFDGQLGSVSVVDSIMHLGFSRDLHGADLTGERTNHFAVGILRYTGVNNLYRLRGCGGIFIGGTGGTGTANAVVGIGDIGILRLGAFLCRLRGFLGRICRCLSGRRSILGIHNRFCGICGRKGRLLLFLSTALTHGQAQHNTHHDANQPDDQSDLFFIHTHDSRSFLFVLVRFGLLV